MTRVAAATLLRLSVQSLETVVEVFQKGKHRERQEVGHDCGHTFRLHIESRGHASGPGSHSDANYWMPNKTVEVRAHSLKEAFIAAAALPLSDFFEDEEVEP